MKQLSSCTFKLKINGCDFRNGRNAGHGPQVFIQIWINEELKAHWRSGGQKKVEHADKSHYWLSNWYSGCMAPPSHNTAQISPRTAHCHRVSIPRFWGPLTLTQSSAKVSCWKGKTSELSQGNELKELKLNMKKKEYFRDVTNAM